MSKTLVLAPAKINLTFDILGTLPDGYHEVETLLQSVDLCDRLTFDLQDAPETRVSLSAIVQAKDAAEQSTNGASEFPTGGNNLIAKAAHAFSRATKKTFALTAEVEKNIPIGAGLAGGSADAAATLVFLNTAFNHPLGKQGLSTVAGELGADVPFCLDGGTAVGTRRGDLLTAVESKAQFVLCIVKPRNYSVSTPWAYGKFDSYDKQVEHPAIAKAIDALKEGHSLKATAHFGNVFEPVIFAEHPPLITLKQRLLDCGARYVQLSGSGPALFAVVETLEQAEAIRRKIMGESPDANTSIAASSAAASNLDFHICVSSSKGIQLIG